MSLALIILWNALQRLHPFPVFTGSGKYPIGQ
ncbi:hypothetical protein NXF25_006690 [Crotalus adamanteus]|uniref:Uncharacterized protein n=1 Tax=Crotalus adamanteus TaxID=8729 RepID=A0AAW1C1F4_CROAD